MSSCKGKNLSHGCMMEGLFSFDDQIFQESSNGKTKIEECYKAKNCHREVCLLRGLFPGGDKIHELLNTWE